MAPSRTLTALVCILALAACAPGDGPPTQPVAASSLDVAGETAETFELADIDRTAMGSSGKPGNQSATGHGNLTLRGELRTFSFNAIRHPDGEVTGQFQLKSRATDAIIHGEVNCMLIVPRPGGGAAFMGGVVTHTQGDPAGFFPGRPVVFTAVDNGEGSKARFPDLLSLLFATTALNVQRQCTSGFGLGASPIDEGNIQVRP